MSSKTKFLTISPALKPNSPSSALNKKKSWYRFKNILRRQTLPSTNSKTLFRCLSITFGLEPSSTSAALLSSSTPPPKSGILPNPPVDQKLKAVPYGMQHTSTGLSPGTPKAQLEPLFSFGFMSPPHCSQHTAGPPPATTQAPNMPPVPHDQYTHLPCHFDNNVIRHIRPTASTFDGRGDPTMFLDWVQAMEDYFDWFNLTDAHKLRIGKMTLRGAARLYWNSVEEQLYQFGRPPVTLWNEMKFKLREQYVPTFYLEQLFDQLWTISQGNSTVTEFHARFIKQKKRAGIREEPGITVSRFIHGLHDDIKHEVYRFDPHCLEDAYCHALEAEAYLQPQHLGYSGQPATAYQTLPTTGSRSMFETLRLGKPLILVVNEDLMDNHQSELAEELAERKHLYYARPQTLCRTIANMNLDYLIPYPGDATPVAKLINRFLGFSDD